MTAPCDLAGRGVLVTRPAGQSGGLCALIAEAGGRPIPFPVLEIAPVADPGPARALLAKPCDLLIFVSRNAVEQALALTSGDGTWPRADRLAAVGRATASALTEAGRAPDLVPEERFDSESLLARPELAHMRGRQVLIARGEGGRPLLGDVLAGRGATVHYAEVYRRVRPDLDPTDLVRRWADEVHLVTATSDEVLLSLQSILGDPGRAVLHTTPLVVISERGAATARGLGFQRVGAAERAADNAIVEALCALVRETP
jgi:uroporphyrinogen-III synthase